MIAFLSGKLIRVSTDWIVVDVGGVGYKVFTPLIASAKLPSMGENIEVFISTIVREDAISLFGFENEIQQNLFEMLLTVSGVGPKVALSILTVIEVDHIIGAISSDNHSEFSRVPGIGNKTAQKIVIELKEKVIKLNWDLKAIPAERRVVEDAIEGLLALGYNRNDARKAAETVVKSIKDVNDSGTIIRNSLKLLSKG